MKKRLLALILCLATTISVCACGNSNNVDGTEVSESNEVDLSTDITLADYSDPTKILTGDYEVTDTMCSYYFNQLLAERNLLLKKVTDRDTVEKGDIVKTDYTGYLNGEAFQGGSATEQWIDVTNNAGYDMTTGYITNGFIEGFTDGLVGAKIGESKSSKVTFPENYGNQDLAGKETTFKFKVHEIYVRNLPNNITDEFVVENFSKTHNVNTVDEFMKLVRAELAYTYCVDYLHENSTFDISKDYLNSRLKDYQNYFEKLYCGDMKIEDYLAQFDYTVEEMQVEWLEAVTEKIQLELIYAAIVEKEGLKVDEKTHEANIQAIIDANGEFFPTADSIYEYVGGGNIEAGKAYMENEVAVKNYFVEVLGNK